MHEEVNRRAAVALRLSSRIEQLEYARAIIRELRNMMAADRFEMLTLQLEPAALAAPLSVEPSLVSRRNGIPYTTPDLPDSIRSAA